MKRIVKFRFVPARKQPTFQAAYSTRVLKPAKTEWRRPFSRFPGTLIHLKAKARSQSSPTRPRRRGEVKRTIALKSSLRRKLSPKVSRLFSTIFDDRCGNLQHFLRLLKKAKKEHRTNSLFLVPKMDNYFGALWRKANAMLGFPLQKGAKIVCFKWKDSKIRSDYFIRAPKAGFSKDRTPQRIDGGSGGQAQQHKACERRWPTT